MREVQRDWAATLHDLWRSTADITARDDLADLILPVLLGLPGVRLVWGLRHGSGEGVIAYRWAGPPIRGTDRPVAERLARCRDGRHPVVRPAEDPEVRAHGAEQVVIGGLEVRGEAAGSFLVGVDDRADVPLVVECLRQVIDVTRDAISRLRIRRIQEEQQLRDALLAEASLQMDAVLDVDQTLQRVARMTVPAIAEGCLVYVPENGRPGLRSSVHVDTRRLAGLLGDASALDAFAGLAARALTGDGPQVAADGLPGADRVLAQVLRARGRQLGVLVFLFDRRADQLPPASFLGDLAHRAALAIDNSELYEARRLDVLEMQRHLLPARLPADDHVELAAAYTVGDQALEVGGDFYDVVRRPDGALAAMIGDVCGRGAAAAALTGMARHTLTMLLQEGVSPARALARLNTGLRQEASWRFVTAGVALLRPDAGGVAVQWMSAGHPVPLVLRKDGPAEEARGGGVALGVQDRQRVARTHLRLNPGDTLVLYTDGLTESRNSAREMFETSALWAAVEKSRDAAPDELVRELSNASAAFGGSAADDIAVLAIRVREPRSR